MVRLCKKKKENKRRHCCYTNLYQVRNGFINDLYVEDPTEGISHNCFKIIQHMATLRLWFTLICFVDILSFYESLIMVFTTAVNFIRARGPDEFWRKRKIFKLAAHYLGRRRNCYSITIRNVHRALVYATTGRKLKKIDMANLWETRVKAGCEEHEIPYDTFSEGLARCDILLNRKTLSELACWEPYTFKALADVARRRAIDDGLKGVTNKNDIDRILTRGSLNKS